MTEDGDPERGLLAAKKSGEKVVTLDLTATRPSGVILTEKEKEKVAFRPEGARKNN